MEEFSELEMRILSELEEAWEEAFQTMLVTVTDCTGDQNEIEDLKQALVLGAAPYGSGESTAAGR